MTDAPTTLRLRRPDDWHVHLRDGAMLRAVAPWTARNFARALVMPNLVPPVATVAAAEAYRARILEAATGDAAFTPLMACYLTDQTEPDEVARGFADGVFLAVKLYPAGATTHSALGVTDIARVRGVLARLERIGMPLCVHGEVTDPEVDVFDREAVFVERVLAPLVRDFPGLKVVLEHVTSEEGVAFVAAAGPNVAATVTPHHMLLNRNALFAGGLRPHAYCLPVAKRERHRQAVRRAATSGAASFFLGTDSAPHPVSAKEAECGCAGIFNAPSALACYAEAFAADGALDRLEAFAALNGPAFYGLPPNEETVCLEAAAEEMAETIPVAGTEETLRPFRAGETLAWRLAAA